MPCHEFCIKIISEAFRKTSTVELLFHNEAPEQASNKQHERRDIEGNFRQQRLRVRFPKTNEIRSTQLNCRANKGPSA